jgi:hypothetical protein
MLRQRDFTTSPAILSWRNRLWLVEKLAPRNSQKNKSGQNALQTIFSNRLDIFDPQFWSVFLKMQLFHQPRLIAPAILQPNDGLRFRF